MQKMELLRATSGNLGRFEIIKDNPNAPLGYYITEETATHELHMLANELAQEGWVLSFFNPNENRYGTYYFYRPKAS